MKNMMPKVTMYIFLDVSSMNDQISFALNTLHNIMNHFMLDLYCSYKSISDNNGI